MSQKKLLHDMAEKIKMLGESLTRYADSLFDIEEMNLEEFESIAPPKKLTMEDVRKVMAEKSSSGFANEVKALIKKHGAERLSAIDPSHYEELLKEVEQIGS
jgi:hypothetical protein